jgi:hypothetical protein
VSLTSLGTHSLLNMQDDNSSYFNSDVLLNNSTLRGKIEREYYVNKTGNIISTLGNNV